MAKVVKKTVKKRPSKKKKEPIGVRYRNPGCIRYRRGYPKSGGFAVFPNYKVGYYALNSLLYRKYDACTLRELFSAYAPRYDKNDPTGYALSVCKVLKKNGYNVKWNSTPLDMRDPNLRAALVCGIATMECGLPMGAAFATRESLAYDFSTDSEPILNEAKKRRQQRFGKGKIPFRTHIASTDDGVIVATGGKHTTKMAKIQKAPASPSSHTYGAFANRRDKESKKISWWGLVFGGASKREINSYTSYLIMQQENIRPPKPLSRFKRIMPPFLGGASVEEKLLDKAYYPDGKNLNPNMREIFSGVRVVDLAGAGFKKDQIINIYKGVKAREKAHAESLKKKGLIHRLGDASLMPKLTEKDLNLTKEEFDKILAIQSRHR